TARGRRTCRRGARRQHPRPRATRSGRNGRTQADLAEEQRRARPPRPRLRSSPRAASPTPWTESPGKTRWWWRCWRKPRDDRAPACRTRVPREGETREGETRRWTRPLLHSAVEREPHGHVHVAGVAGEVHLHPLDGTHRHRDRVRAT